MREKFPRKKPGDPLSAKHVNKLSRIAERFAKMVPGGSISGRHGDTYASMVGQIPWKQFIVIVSNTKIDASDTDTSGYYLIQIRWHSNTGSSWESDDKEWELDARDVDLSLTVGDKLIAHWDEQRGMFVPTSSFDGGIRFFELKEDLSPGGDALVYLREIGSACSLTTNLGSTFTVYDDIGDRQGTGRDSAPRGAYGKAIRKGGCWWVFDLECP